MRSKSQNRDLSAILALKAARSILGLTQDEVAELSGVAKPTIARLETLIGKSNFSTISTLLSVYREKGIEISDVTAGDVSIKITAEAVQFAEENMTKSSRRRSDYRD